ncbi:MAG: archaeal proteasome endopeptidase complex subunit beta [Vulcanisaeta sp.]|jgi:proteasome beta subunit|nr:archaeal proteasome endopeptidase complex subunit beta [Vulcanisaeta sp.]MCG2870420.1 archaeal proteasome endopeptidase complex subunit beta [Vulcanisaeta sp.]MCG2870433.1 archaeal proteasome endopeptidase complex subunit beta [Vulcanisaeta sp.]MCG2879903.1 archaeal proteasome endopeptidase complex subunit beta [Vulcanisaeta sp.]MCG2886741.1 archaeal proteasome endopeptidase complex subunit beta [Vulcanisaeta sp.]
MASIEELITGTAVGIKARDGVVLAAEKRVAYGFTVFSRSGKKVFKVNDNIGIASIGILADMQVLTKIARAYMSLYALDTRSRPSIRSAAKLLSYVLFSNRVLPYFVEVLVGGVDDEGPHLFVMDSLGSLIEDDYAAVGTGTKLAVAILESNYRPDISVKEARELAIKAINQSISRDPVSGDGIDILIITSNGTSEETIPLQPLRLA